MRIQKNCVQTWFVLWILGTWSWLHTLLQGCVQTNSQVQHHQSSTWCNPLDLAKWICGSTWSGIRIWASWQTNIWASVDWIHCGWQGFEQSWWTWNDGRPFLSGYFPFGDSELGEEVEIMWYEVIFWEMTTFMYVFSGGWCGICFDFGSAIMT